MDKATKFVASSITWPKVLPSPGEAIRIHGDAPSAIKEGEMWKSNDLLIDTPLPQGYPAPTPAECLEIKTYPVERRAEFKNENLWFKSILGDSRAFWNLFSHIKNR